MMIGKFCFLDFLFLLFNKNFLDFIHGSIFPFLACDAALGVYKQRWQIIHKENLTLLSFSYEEF